jgi:hypothetical protein
MSYSKARKPSINMKKLYNKWRLAALTLNVAGLMTFFFALGMAGLTVPLMVASVLMLWAAVAVSYKYLMNEMGKPFEAMARLSNFISLILAILLSVLAVITIMNG